MKFVNARGPEMHISDPNLPSSRILESLSEPAMWEERLGSVLQTEQILSVHLLPLFQHLKASQ